MTLFGWRYCWTRWEKGEPYWCVGAHMYPDGPLWNAFGFQKDKAVDAVIFHFGPVAMLWAKEPS